MVFALAANKACVEAVECAPPRRNPPRNKRSKGKKRARLCLAYTAYIYLVSAGTVSVVEPGDEEAYSELLKFIRLFPGVDEAQTKIDCQICKAEYGPWPGGSP